MPETEETLIVPEDPSDLPPLNLPSSSTALLVFSRLISLVLALTSGLSYAIIFPFASLLTLTTSFG